MNVNIPTVLERTEIFHVGNVGTKREDLLKLINNHAIEQVLFENFHKILLTVKILLYFSQAMGKNKRRIM